MSRIIAAVEIGTSKVVTLLGEVEGSSLDLIGVGKCTAQGVAKGTIESVPEASRCVHASLRAAEQQAGVQADEVFLALTGRHVDGFANPGKVNVRGEFGEVTTDDLRRVADEAKARALADGRTYVCHVRSGYLLDGEVVTDPLGKQGQQLEAFYWHIHAGSHHLADAIHIINGYGQLPVSDVIPSSLASGTLVATREEKKLGTLVVDMGAGTTDFVLYRHGRVQRTGTIAVGGDHFTNDLAIAMRINFDQAESLKLRHGKAMVDPAEKTDKVLALGDMSIGDRQVPQSSIDKVLFLRAQELFQIIANRLGSQISPQNLPAGVILTGGAARLDRVVELAEKTFQVQCRLGRTPSDMARGELKDPEFATAVGLLHYGLRGAPQDRPPAPAPTKQRLLEKVIKIFR